MCREPPKQISSRFDEKQIVATTFCVYKGISKKYKGKYATDHFCSHLRQDCQIDLPSSQDCHICIAVSENTHFSHI
jgi:hypothetical protein